MGTEKKVIPVLRVSLTADDEQQYRKRIDELKNLMGITDFGGGYNMGVRMSVVIEGGSTTLVVHKEGEEDHLIDIEYFEYNDDDSGDEDYYFIGSKDDPNDELLVVATVRKYQWEE